MVFTYFKGNQNVKDRVSSLVESSRLPHAILIEGEAGAWKKNACKGDCLRARMPRQRSKTLLFLRPVQKSFKPGSSRYF